MSTSGSPSGAAGDARPALDLTASQKAAVARLARDENVIPPPIALARDAVLPNDAIERQHALADPAGFWGERARAVDWLEPWSEVLRFTPPRHEWFVGGRLNASVNCIDRHVYGDRRNKAALLWVGEDGEEQAYTYGRLYREVCRFGNALRRLGIGKGDRVVIYMPLVPEGIVAMLACARIGAIHSVVFAGMGTEALRARLVDSGARARTTRGGAAGRSRSSPPWTRPCATWSRSST